MFQYINKYHIVLQKANLNISVYGFLRSVETFERKQ